MYLMSHLNVSFNHVCETFISWLSGINTLKIKWLESYGKFGMNIDYKKYIFQYTTYYTSFEQKYCFTPVLTTLHIYN